MLIILILSLSHVYGLSILKPTDSMYHDLYLSYMNEIQLGRNREPRMWEGNGECKDLSPLCLQLKRSGCSAQVALSNCPKTCGICPKPKPSSGGECEDHDDGCRAMAKYCSKHKEIETKCPKTCGLCEGDTNCKDTHSLCPNMKRGCGENPKVNEMCPLTCGDCNIEEPEKQDNSDQREHYDYVCKDNHLLCSSMWRGCGRDPRIDKICPLTCKVCTIEEPEEEEDNNNTGYYEYEYEKKEDKSKKKSKYQETAYAGPGGPGFTDDDYNSDEKPQKQQFSSHDQDCPAEGCGNGDCLNSYYCQCWPGWTGPRCDQEEVDEECPGGCGRGECVGPSLCDCYEGWGGYKCDQALCDDNCSGNGRCVKPGQCECEKGFIGRQCQYDTTLSVTLTESRPTRIKPVDGLSMQKTDRTSQLGKFPSISKGADNNGCQDASPDCNSLKMFCDMKEIREGHLCDKTCGFCGADQSPRPIKTKGGSSKSKGFTLFGLPKPTETKGGSTKRKESDMFEPTASPPRKGSNLNGRKSIGREPCECGRPNELGFGAKIVGGDEVKPPHRYPWQVALKRGKYYTASCGGTLINKKWVLSAAHCYGEFTTSNCKNDAGGERFIVVIGEHDQKTKKDNAPYYEEINVKRHINHPQWNCHTFRFDFSLLELIKPVNFKGHLQPICLPADDSKTYGGEKATVSGWGLTSEGGSQSKTLQQVILTVRDLNCGGYTGFQMSPEKMCVGGYEKGLDSCQGDSGGPLFLRHAKGHIQIGVVSSGFGCAHDGVPGVYARISKVLGWINTVTNMYQGYCIRN